MDMFGRTMIERIAQLSFLLKTRWIQLLVLLLIVPGTFMAQELSYIHFDVREGLPSRTIYNLTQDKDGYLWICTSGGVCRYDGLKFEVFSINDGLADIETFSAKQDIHGRIWFDAFNGKISYWEKGIIKQLEDSKLPPEFVSNSERPIYELDKDSAICITKTGMMCRINSDLTIQFFKSNVENKIVEAFSDYKNNTNAWLCHDGIYIEQNNQLVKDTTWTPADAREAHNLNGKMYFVRSVNPRISIFQNGKISDLVELSFINSSLNDATYLKKCGPNSLFVINPLDGVFQVSTVDGQLQNHFLPGMVVHYAMIDRDGNTWLATASNGLFMLPANPVYTFNSSTGLGHSDVASIAFANDQLIAGFRNGNFQFLDDKTMYRTWPGINENRIRQMHPIGDSLCICADRGLFWLHNGKLDTIVENCKDLSIHNDKLYLASYLGLFEGKLGEDTIRQIYKRRVHTLCAAKDNKVWFYCNEGLKYWRNEVLHDYYDEKLGTNIRVIDMEELPDGKLALATQGKGVIIIGGSNSVAINTSNGLSSDISHRVRYYQDQVWIGTNKGLDVLNYKDGIPDVSSIRHYDSSLGLNSDYITDVICKGDSVWVSTDKGVNMFTEKDLISSGNPVILERLDTYDSTYYAFDNIVLDPNNSGIGLFFTSISLSNPRKTKFLYRLLPIDTVWRKSNEMSVNYSALPPGEYEFQVKARVKGQVIPNSLASCKIVVTQPFFLTIWFILLMVLVGLLLMFYMFSSIRRFYQRRQLRQQRLYNLEKNALRAQMNPHFIFNSLNSINDFIADNDRRSAHNYLSRFAKLMRLTLDGSRKDKVSLRNELDALGIYIELEQMRFPGKFDFELQVNSGLNPDKINIPSMMIQPFAENAIKHGLLNKEGKGKLLIETSIQNGRLIISVDDDGIGRSGTMTKNGDHNHTSTATSITDERMKMMQYNGTGVYELKILDKTDPLGNSLGTRVELIFPIK